MAVYFFDSSAVVKRYINETGTLWVQSIADPRSGNLIYIAAITSVEVVAAITRRMKSGSITSQGGYDAIQLAAALEVNANLLSLAMPALTLVSSDNDLNVAASVEALKIENPILH